MVLLEYHMLKKGLVIAGSVAVFVGILLLAGGGLVKLVGGGLILGGLIVFLMGFRINKSPTR
jgi:hypothetical protein